MKTKEFVVKVEELGYSVRENDSCINVHNEKDLIMKVYNMTPNTIDTYWNDDVPSDLFDLGVEYAKTPIQERKDPKKYYLTLPIEYSNNSVLNYGCFSERFYFDSRDEGSHRKTQFTLEEIKDLPNQDFINALEKELVE